LFPGEGLDVVWPWRTHVTCCGAATHIFLQLTPDLLIFLKAQASKVIEFRSSRLSPTLDLNSTISLPQRLSP
jgi:hypothetical protein